MPPRAYAGAWRAAHTYEDRALAPAPGVDPAHRYPDLPDEGARPPEGAPRMDAPPMFLTETEDASYAAELDTPGLVLDLEPITHEGEISVPVPDPQHTVSRGAELRQLHAPPFMRQHDEHPISPRVESVPVTGDLTLSSKRGRNSLPENNPEGYRYGWTVYRRTNRRMFHGFHGHTERLLRPNTAAAATVSPAPTKGNRYESPFSWNRFNVNLGIAFPMQRRNPDAQWSESVATDGADQSSPIGHDFVIG